VHYGKLNPMIAIELSRYDLADSGRVTKLNGADRTGSAPGRVASWKRLVRMLPFEDSEPITKGDRRDLDPG
jgi:hypothetical protein